MKDPSLLLLGGGYTLECLLCDLEKKKPDVSVLITTRDPLKARRFTRNNSLGVTISSPNELASLLREYPTINKVVDSIPPPENYSAGYAEVLVDYFHRNSLSTLLYLSTTGVYERVDGSWVDETILVKPLQSRLVARVTVEQAYLKLRDNRRSNRVTVVRPAAIYGLERGLHQALKRGSFPRINDNRWSNRIHVEDLSNILYELCFVIDGDLPPIINAADRLPTPINEVIEAYCRELNLPIPEIISIEEAKQKGLGMASLLGSQRVSTQLLQDLLTTELKYPSFREGLKYIVNSSTV
jgi:nucleoside-diphosphate-sugar epimerase